MSFINATNVERNSGILTSAHDALEADPFAMDIRQFRSTVGSEGAPVNEATPTISTITSFVISAAKYASIALAC